MATFDELGISAGLLQARGLTRQPEASTLEVAEVGDDGREHRLVPSAASAWRELKAAALQDGEIVFIVSAFRSVSRQAEIIRGKLQLGLSIDQIITVCSPPGYSEHHTGCAVDLSTIGVRPLEVELEGTSAFRWLEENAARFGFVMSYPADNPYGYQYEPWHWCHHVVGTVDRSK